MKKDYNKKYYQEKKDEINEKRAVARQLNRNKFRTKSKKYYEINKEKVKKKQKETYTSNKEFFRAYNRRYYAAHKDELNKKRGQNRREKELLDFENQLGIGCVSEGG